MSKLRSDELVNKEGTGGPNFPQGVTTIDPITDNHTATKLYVDSTVSFYGGNSISPTAPANPAIGSFWTDTSASPCTLKVWNGYDWIEFSEDESFTGVIDSPVTVHTPFDGDGVPFDYTPATDIISSTEELFLSGMLDQRNDVGLLKGREDYYTSGRPDGSNSLSGIKGIAYGKGTYVFLSANEGIAYSKTGGRTWTVVPLPDASTYWYKLIYTGDNHFGGRFVAVGGSAGKQAMWSDDGVTWNLATTLPADGSYTDLDIDPVSGRIVAAGIAPQISYSNGQSPYMYSDDGGETWTRSTKTSQNWQGRYCIAYGNGIWVSPAYNKTDPSNADGWPEYSTDGINWNVANNTTGGTGATRDIAYESIVFDHHNGRFVTVGKNPKSGNYHRQYATTTDGLNWSESNMPSDSQGVSYDWDTDYTQILYGNGVFILGGKASQWPAGAQQGYKITNSWLPGGSPYFSEQFMLPTKAGSTDSDASRITAMEYVDNRFVIACADGSIFLTERNLPYGTIPVFSAEKEAGKYINFNSSRIYNLENAFEWVPNFEISDLFDGSINGVKDISTDTDIDVVSVLGSALKVSSLEGVTVGNRLKATDPVVYGLDPDVVKFTTRNAGSPIVKSTDATLAFRRWTLETRSSDTDPWILVTEADDYSPVADQDGVIPWAERPTLQEDTQYRVKVAYHSSNAETIESEYQEFQVGKDGAGMQLSVTGTLVDDAQVSTITYQGTTTLMDLNLASEVFAADLGAEVGKYVQITGSSLALANGVFPIIDVDAGEGSGFITLLLSQFTPPDDLEHIWSYSPETAEIRIQSQPVAITLGYREQALAIASSMVESITTIGGYTDAHIKLSSGVFSEQARASDGDMVEITGAVLPANTMDPEKAELLSYNGSEVYRTISDDGLTIRNVGRNTFAGRVFSARPMSPNTGTYYWEVTSTTFADPQNELPTSHAAFEVWLAGHSGTGPTNYSSDGLWRMYMTQPNTNFPEGDARRKTNYVYHGWSNFNAPGFPHYAGEVIGFEYNSDSGQLKVTFDGVVVYDQTNSFLMTDDLHVIISEKNIGNEITMHFSRDSWQYAPNNPDLKESGAGDSNMNGQWEITHINDDQVDGPELRLSTYAYDESLNAQHTLGARSYSSFHDNQWGNNTWVEVKLSYPVSAIEFSADRGDAAGEKSRDINNRYNQIKLYQIKIGNSIISETNTYSGTLTAESPFNVYRDYNAFRTYSTAHYDAASLSGYQTYSSSTSDSDSYLLPLGTNYDRYTDLGKMVFTPGRSIPANSTIRIKVSSGTKLTFICGPSYTPHDGSVISIRMPGGDTLFSSSLVTPWFDGQPGVIRIGAPQLFENENSSSGSSGGSSSGSGDSSGGSSGGGY